MKVVVRPLKSTDLQEFVRLRTLVYPNLDPYKYASVWRWLEGHPLATEMHRWVLATKDRVVGHLAATPQLYRINGHRVVAHTPADYMVLPQYGFHALVLMRTFFRTCRNCVACDQAREAILIEKRLGAEEVGSLQYAAKLLDISQLPKLPASTPAPVPRIINWGLRGINRGLIASLSSNLVVQVLNEFDESFDTFFENIAAVVPCLPEKDRAFLEWRYGPGSPHAPVTVLAVQGGEGLLGYAVLRITSTAPRYGYLLDVMTLPERRDVGRALLRETIERFIRSGVYVVRCQFLESPTSPLPSDLWRLGFFRERDPNTLLVKFADRSLQEAARDPSNWAYSAGDGEGSFWVG